MRKYDNTFSWKRLLAKEASVKLSFANEKQMDEDALSSRYLLRKCRKKKPSRLSKRLFC
jgi:hypothetical protein